MAAPSPDSTYDFIICGGGTSGCVVAARLAEDPTVKVLVIEAGQHNEHLENVHMVGGWSSNFDSETDWNIVSTPGAGVNNREVKLSRGKFLGGSSGCNGTLMVKGMKQDIDDWKLPGWSGEEFFNYMTKAENFHTKDWFKETKGAHGHSGHVHTEPHDLAPISNMIGESMVSKGLPLDHDMFAAGNNPHGCGHSVRTVHGGIRTTSADFITKQKPKNNLHLLVETHVEKVIIEKVSQGDNLKATGVRAVRNDGTVFELRARKEVIISGGAYCSPNILNRSGIGAKSELDRHGIDKLVDLPGVGKNLQDHLIVFIFYETEKKGITTDSLLYHGDALAEAYTQWKEEKKGPLTSFPFGIFAYARMDERLADSKIWNSAPRKQGRDPMGLTSRQPQIEFFTTECYGGPKQYDQFPTNGHAFSIIAELFAPKSRGTVTLRNKDASSIPVVDCNYLSDPLDLEVLAEACAFGNEIITEGTGTKDIVKGSWPPNLVHHTYKTREDWKEYVKDNATTCYHASGTCAAGRRADNPYAVVDENLQVWGVKGLRVVDCSIMPTVINGHTQMPAYGIGEKAADLIKDTWSSLSAKL